MKPYMGILVKHKLPAHLVKAWNSLRAQRRRCNVPKQPDYRYYGGKGIRVRYSTRDFLGWWEQEMQRYPVGTKLSVNRIDSDKDYTFDNVELITHVANVVESNARTHTKAVVQLSLSGDFIAEFRSQKEAIQKTGASQSFVSQSVKHGVSSAPRLPYYFVLK